MAQPRGFANAPTSLPGVVAGHVTAIRLTFAWERARESNPKLQGRDPILHAQSFFNSLKSKVGHIMAKASALRVNMNLAPTVPSTSRARTSTSHAPLLFALNLSHHVLPPYRA